MTWITIFEVSTRTNRSEDIPIDLRVEHHQVSDEARTRILELYETLSDREIRPVLTSDITEKQDSAYLLMALFGDIAMNAAQRLVCESFSRTASCYNFIFGGIPSWNTNTNLGATHGSEIAPLFQNFEGLGFEQNPFAGKGEGYRGMSRLMGTMWAGFISSLDPMAGLSRSPYRWPRYDTLDPGVFVFDETSTGRLIRDDYRSDAMSYLNEIQSSTFDR